MTLGSLIVEIYPVINWDLSSYKRGLSGVVLSRDGATSSVGNILRMVHWFWTL